jgi:hypothetical protein
MNAGSRNMSPSPEIPERSIIDLEALVNGLTPADRQRFHRIYSFTIGDAHLRVPSTMVTWVEEQFHSVSAVESQRIVRVVNLVTGEGALFNRLRGLRPVHSSADTGHGSLIMDTENDILARPLELTPEDPFGRLENDHGVTAANVAKYDMLHGLVVFRNADPMAFTRESLAGHLDLAQQWMRAAHRWDADARYPYMLWNCLWRAGGSLLHGHYQMLMGKGMHYTKIERLRRDALDYGQRYGVDYFEELADVHLALRCAYRVGQACVMAHLTPLRDKEVVITAPRLNAEVVDAIYQVLVAYRDRLGVGSFNMGVLMPPVVPVSESWDGFPIMIRLVDRGALDSRTSDVGGMELFAESVVASDPFAVARSLGFSGEGD